jgi:hypothetical protein
MKRLKIWHRIALLFLVMLAGNVVSVALLNSEKNEAINFIGKEHNGLLYLEPLRQIRQWLPAYARLAEADAKLVDPAANPAPLLHIVEAMRRLDDLDRRLEHELNTTEDFVGLKMNWAELQNAVSNPESFRVMHATLNNRVMALIALAGDSSNLILDAVLARYYLINVVVVDLPTSDNLLNNLMDFGHAVIAKPQLSVEEHNRLLIMASALKTELDNTNSHLEVAIEEDPDLAPLEMARRDHASKMLTLLAYLDSNMISQKSAKTTSADFTAVVQAALDENFKLYDAVSPNLGRMLQQRYDNLSADKRQVIGLILLLSLAGLVLTVWTSRSISGSTNRATHALEAPDGAGVTKATVTPARIAPELIQENQDLKSLVAELSLENRSLKNKSASATAR